MNDSHIIQVLSTLNVVSYSSKLIK